MGPIGDGEFGIDTKDLRSITWRYSAVGQSQRVIFAYASWKNIAGQFRVSICFINKNAQNSPPDIMMMLPNF